MNKRGDVYFADLSPVIGSEQGGTRPVVIIQNDLGNHFSPTVIVAAITAKMAKAKLPTHVEIKAADTGISKDSIILLEQVRTIDKSRLKEKVCHLSPDIMRKIDDAILVSFGITANLPKRKNDRKNTEKRTYRSERKNGRKSERVVYKRNEQQMEQKLEYN